ncbi:MAG: response regulator transcription factor [Planctomycetes bacterium]|nr:response regulator transcription factor [Planctomycetota bacterium]
MQSTRIILVEDIAALREGLAAILGATADFEVVGSFPSMEPALARLTELRPHVAFVDLGLPGMSGLEGVRRIRDSCPDTQVLVLTVHDDDAHVFEAICGGATGYLLKDSRPERLIEAVREVRSGGAPMSPSIARRVVATFRTVAPKARDPHRLSPREVEILDLLAQGHSYKTAAATLDLSIDTVRFHVRNSYGKLHVHSKSAAVRAAFRDGILS